VTAVAADRQDESVSEPSDLPRAAFVEQVMGLPVSVHVRGPRAREPFVAEVVAAAFAGLHEADRLFSTYRADSDVSRLDAGTLALGDADPLVREVLELCERARADTGGLFDIQLPGPDGRRHLDPSGLVKGWAAERAAAVVAAIEGHEFCLNAGGDVCVGGAADGGGPWRIGLERPGGPGLLGFVELRAGAVATSGTAARGEHLVDPRTGLAPRGVGSVTVTGPSLTRTDVLATAAFVRGADATSWIAGFPGHAVLVVSADGAVTTSPGFALHPLP
jgi:thiamine biosynthesis lipoprotein